MSVKDLPGLELLNKIGESVAAEVWKAHQKALDRIVAVKILKPDIAADPDEIKNFINEARVAAKLRHPSIIQVYDVGVYNNIYYLVMEFIAGPNIKERVEADGPFSEKETVRIALAVAQALKYAWDTQRIIHRDIKPTNIMIDLDGTVKVSDLGLAVRTNYTRARHKKQPVRIEGTPYFMSPEQAQCIMAVDFATDMFSLGATMYYMLTAKVPFGEYSPLEAINSVVLDRLPDPRIFNPEISFAMVQLLRKLMMRNPLERFSDWESVINAIKKKYTIKHVYNNIGNNTDSVIETVKVTPLTQKFLNNINIKKPSRVFPHLIALTCIIVSWIITGKTLSTLPFREIKISERTYKYTHENSKNKIESPKNNHVDTIQNDIRNDETKKIEEIKEKGDADQEKLEIIEKKETSKDEFIENVSTVKENSGTYVISVDSKRIIVEKNIEEEIEKIKKRVVELISSYKIDDAIQFLDKNIVDIESTSAKKELRTIRMLILKLKFLDEFVSRNLSGYFGKQIKIRKIGNEDKIKIILSHMINDKFYGWIVKSDGSKGEEISFTISEIDPRDIIELLDVPSGVEDMLVRYVLLCRAEMYEEASRYADKCGLIGNECVKYLKEKLERSSGEIKDGQ